MRFPRALVPLAVLAALALAGCGNEPATTADPPSEVPRTATPTASTSPSASTTASPSASASVDGVVIDISLTDGGASPNGTKINVSKGQTVTLNVTSDRTDEVHVHGDYDIDVPVTPGASVSRSFVADKTGSVEVESHEPEKIIAILNIR